MASVTWLITLCHLYTGIMYTDEVSIRQVKEHQGPGESPLVFIFVLMNYSNFSFSLCLQPKATTTVYRALEKASLVAAPPAWQHCIPHWRQLS